MLKNMKINIGYKKIKGILETRIPFYIISYYFTPRIGMP